jgi:hypothetical protein
MSRIETAIQNLYLAFSDVEKPTEVEGCPCCIDRKNISALLETPLAQISSDDLSPYASSAFLTVGEVDDYRYFLPRILEVSFYDDSFWPDVAITGRAMNSANISSEPAAKVRAVQQFFEAAIASFISNGDLDRIDDWICGAAKAVLDIRPLLQLVETDDAAILEFFNANSGALGEGKLGNEFWESYDPGQETILKWFMSENVRRVPYEAYGYTYSNEP